jgi:murein hydrolase activator
MLHENIKLATNNNIMWQRLFIILFGLSICFLHKHSHAQTFEDKKTELEKIQTSLQRTENARSLTQTKLRHLSRDMTALEQDIVQKASAIKKIETELYAQEKRLKELAYEEQNKTNHLDSNKKQASKLISAAWSLQHRPQIAAWLLPEQNRERALTVRALHVSTLSVKHDIDAINRSMRELNEIRFTMLQTQKDRTGLRQNLNNEKAALALQLDEQQQLQATLQQDDEIYAQKLDSLIAKSEDLQGLVSSLEAEKQKNEQAFANIQPLTKPNIQVPNDNQNQPQKEAIRQTLSPRILAKAASFGLAKGKLTLPAEGSIIGKFGERRGANDRLKGLQIQAQAGATVTNPYEGEVLFVGDFLDYGNMVIIRHSKQYHTLIAGLSLLNVRRGQFLLEGAPIGAMDNDSKLYLELRNHSQAIDPAPWYAMAR